jgi:hypothetical protein
LLKNGEKPLPNDTGCECEKGDSQPPENYWNGNAKMYLNIHSSAKLLAY